MPFDFTEASPLRYMCEGGTETEIMFRHGYEFEHFAVFELLKNSAAKSALKDMFRAYFDVVAESGFNAMVGGLDYRASPDWSNLLGYSEQGLAEVQHQCIEFLRDIARPYQDQIPDIRYSGIIGPRGDAYALNRSITAEEAEEYHSVQLENLRAANVDLVCGATFNNVPEAVGLARAASQVGIPLILSFTVTGESRLRSGPTLREAVEATDTQAGAAKPLCYGINCSHPAEFLPGIEPGNWIRRVRNIRPNAAMMDKMALCQLNRLEEGDPVDLAARLGDLSETYPHIDMWGGCCGTWDKHLREMGRKIAPRKPV